MRKLHFLLVFVLAAPGAALAAEFGPRSPAPTAIVEPVPYDLEVVDARDASGIHAGADNPADAALAGRVAAALAQDPRLDGATITVVAEDGNVGLAGSADDPSQGQVAQEIAREVAGEGTVTGTLHEQGS